MARELVTIFGTNPQYNIKNINELIVTFVTINSQLPDNLRDEFFTKFETIWKSNQIRKTFIELCRLRAATQKQIQNNTGLSDASVSRAFTYLRDQGLIKPATKVKSLYSKGGPRPTIWATITHNPEDVLRASEDHIEKSSPTYTEAERITQLILDEYLVLKPDWMRKKIHIKEIIGVVRENTTNFQVSDMVKLVAIQLQNQHKINVWRMEGPY